MGSMVLMLLVLRAGAGEDGPQQLTTLEWQAAPECPGADRFVSALAFRTARARIVDGASDAVISIAIDRVGRRFRGRLTLRLPTGVTKREAQSPKCESVVEALSLMSALVIDPEHARLGPLPSVLPPQPPVAATVVEPPPPLVVDPPPPAQPAEPVVSEPPRVEPAATVVTSTPTDVQPSAAAVRLGALVQLTTAISGELDLGGAAALSYQRGLLLARLELGGGSGRTISSATGAGRYDFHLQSNLGVGGALAFGPFGAELLAVAQLTVFTVRAPLAIRPIDATRFSPAVGPLVAVTYSFGQWSVLLRSLVGFNLRRDTYVIDPDGGVFSNPLVFLQPSLGLQVRL